MVIYKPTESDPASSDSDNASASSHGEPAATSGSEHASASQASKYHKVKKGETLSSIAETNHTSVEALKRDNPKIAANLRAGEVLVIKKQ